MTRSQVHVDVPYEHPPVLPAGALLVGAVIVGTAAFAVLRAEPIPTPGRLALVLGVAGLLLCVVAAVTLPSVLRRIRVADDGMHVSGRLALPSTRIGDVQRLDRRDAAALSWPVSRPRGTRIPTRQNLYGGLLGTGPAVAVVARESSSNETLWLIPSRTPDDLVAALVAVRDRAR